MPSTPYTRDLLRSSDAATARTKLGISGDTSSASVFDVATANSIAIYATNTWAGPVAPLPMNQGHQYYSTLTNCVVTGLSNTSNNVAQAVILTIQNSAATNISLYIPASVRTGDGLRTYVITNGGVGKISVERADSLTNAVFRAFW